MEVLVIIVYATISLAACIVWIWSGITLSQYVKEGRSFMAAFTWFWVFNPDWFKEEGQEVFRKERKRFLLTMALLVVFLSGPFFWGLWLSGSA